MNFTTQIHLLDTDDGTTEVVVLVSEEDGHKRWRHRTSLGGRVTEDMVSVEAGHDGYGNAEIKIYRRLLDDVVLAEQCCLEIHHPRMRWGMVYERDGLQRMALKEVGITLGHREIWYAGATQELTGAGTQMHPSKLAIGVMTWDEWLDWIGPASMVEHLILREKSPGGRGHRGALVWDGLYSEKDTSPA